MPPPSPWRAMADRPELPLLRGVERELSARRPSTALRAGKRAQPQRGATADAVDRETFSVSNLSSVCSSVISAGSP